MRALFCFVCLLLVGLFQTNRELYAQQDQLLLTETRALRALTEKEASKGTPVNLEGMIMYCAGFDVTYCMLRDHTGGVLIQDPAMLLEPGMIVAVDGHTMYMKQTWVATGARIQVLGKEPLPPSLKTVEQVRSLSLDRIQPGLSN